MQVTDPQGTLKWLNGTVTKQFSGKSKDEKARAVQDDVTQVYADAVSYAGSHPDTLSYWKHSYYIKLDHADLTATRTDNEPKRSTTPNPNLETIEKSAEGYIEVPEDSGKIARLVATDQPDFHYSLTADRSIGLFGSGRLTANEESIFTGNVDHAVLFDNGESKFSVNKDHLAWLSRPLNQNQ